MVLVVGLVGSPRKDGNTNLLVEYALKLLKEKGTETHQVSFYSSRITPCGKQCNYECLRRRGCTVDDDVSKIYNLIGQSKAFVVGSPVYGHLLPSVMYAFKERAQGLKEGTPFAGKYVVLILVCSEGCERPLSDLREFFGLKSKIIGKVVIETPSIDPPPSKANYSKVKETIDRLSSCL